MLRCLVTGSTGYVGGRLIPELLNAGHQVRAMARDPSDLDALPWVGRVEVVAADLSDPASLVEAFADVDVVYYLVHSMGTSADFADAEAESANNAARAARQAGVRRLVYLGGLHPTGAELSEHLESRTTVGDTLLESGVETIALQAGVIIGAGSASFEMIRLLAAALPVLPVPRWTRHLIQPIAIDDVLHYLVAAADAPVTASRSWDIGGPNVLRYKDVLREFAEVAGLPPRRVITVPLLTPGLVSRGIAVLIPMPVDLVHPLVQSLKHDAVVKDRDIDTIIAPPRHGLTSYRAAVELAMQRPDSATGAQKPNHRDSPAQLMTTDPTWAHHGRR